MSYKMDRRGVGDLLTCEAMQLAMFEFAQKIAIHAFEDSPVDETGPHPGRYKGSWKVTYGVRHARTSRAYGRITNDSPEAFFVEYGTKNNPEHATLRRALVVEY